MPSTVPNAGGVPRDPLVPAMRSVSHSRTPLVTVIIPHHQCGEYLREALLSILRQPLHRIQVLLVDDHSPDADWLAAITSERADPRVEIFQTDQRVGPYRILNAVRPYVRGRFVAFQDADDRSHPLRLAVQLGALRSGATDIIGCGYRTIDEQGRVLRKARMPLRGNAAMRRGQKHAVLHGSAMIRSEALGYGFDGTTRIAADTDFYLRMSYIYRIASLPFCLYDCRIRRNSLTQAADTGYGSLARERYATAIYAQDEARRRCESREALLRSLRAPANDIEFSISPLPLS